MQKLLIVDAAEDFCNALADALKGEYIVRTCNDGEKAFELLNSFCPELLVLDLTVAGIDGLSIVQMISGERRKPGILATTTKIRMNNITDMSASVKKKIVQIMTNLKMPNNFIATNLAIVQKIICVWNITIWKIFSL